MSIKSIATISYKLSPIHKTSVYADMTTKLPSRTPTTPINLMPSS